ncbi:MAG: DUF5060 domain-containing protein [Bacteroidota bacterium]
MVSSPALRAALCAVVLLIPLAHYTAQAQARVDTLVAIEAFEALEVEGYSPYYKDLGRKALAIDAPLYPDGFGAAETTWQGASGTYDMTLVTVMERDGSSTYQLFVDGNHLGDFTNPTGPDLHLAHHTWKGVTLAEGMPIRVTSDIHSNDKEPEDGSFATSRGRWRYLIVSDATDGQNTVGLWDQFEVEVPNATAYADPFRDVDLDVIYTRPDGTEHVFWGFYAADGLWKVRYMPDQLGRWTYRATFSDGAPGIEGHFDVVPSDLPGLVGHDVANPMWLGYRGGRHALVRSLHVGDRFFASNWPAADRTAFLDWAEAQDYNQLSVASFFLNRNVEGRGAGWETPGLWDSEAGQPQPEAYTAAEAILGDLAERGMSIYPFAGFFGQSADYPQTTDAQEVYLRYTMARFGPYWNLLLNVAGPEPLWRPEAFKPGMSASEIIRLGQRIQSVNAFGHVLSVHNETGPDPFRYEAWHDYVTLQGGKEAPGPSVHRYIEQSHTGTKPVFAQEAFWPGNQWHACACTDAETLRRKAFLLLFAGTAINFADMDGNSSSGFSGTLDLSLRNQMWHDEVKAAWDLIDTFPFYLMQPRRDMASAGYVLAEDGVRYVVYLPDASAGTTLDLTAAPGTYRLRWYNPRVRYYLDPPIMLDGDAVINLGLPPDETDQDWIAVVERENPPEFTANEAAVIEIEAEDAVAMQGWESVPSGDGAAMRASDSASEGFLSYPVVFSKPGRYYLHLLTDTAEVRTASATLGGRPLVATSDGVAYTDIPAPGTYTLRIISGGERIEVDKIVLSPSATSPSMD